MPKFSAHYCQGKLPIALVFSVPGKRESEEGKPVSGDTGTNLNVALAWLNSRNPTLFSSPERYDYRITNAFAEPRAKSLGHSSSEAKASEIRASTNIARVIKDLSGCHLVLLCGKKAQLLSAPIEDCGKRVVKIPHPGHRGLNKAFSVTDHPTMRRIDLWARAVLKACSQPDVAADHL
jgi:uracil-DNA glycosylase